MSIRCARWEAQLGFEVEPIGAIERCAETGSGSSTVRRLLAEGRVSRACRELGAPFAIEGVVVKGQGIGSKQTVPTLNLAHLRMKCCQRMACM